MSCDDHLITWEVKYLTRVTSPRDAVDPASHEYPLLIKICKSSNYDHSRPRVDGLEKSDQKDRAQISGNMASQKKTIVIFNWIPCTMIFDIFFTKILLNFVTILIQIFNQPCVLNKFHLNGPFRRRHRRHRGNIETDTALTQGQHPPACRRSH